MEFTVGPNFLNIESLNIIIFIGSVIFRKSQWIRKIDLDNFEWFNLNLTIDDQFFDYETDNLYKKLKLSGI